MRGRADVVIVGAGPAGATTALLLARAGHDVLLLDRQSFPRPKPCGDCLSAGAGAVLHRLGLLDRIRRLPHAQLLGWRIVAPDGGSFAAPFGNRAALPGDTAPAGAERLHAIAMERSRFDAALVQAAIDAGVRFASGVSVIDVVRAADGAVAGVRTRHGTFDARLVVGADGLRSIVARRLGVLQRHARLRKVSLTMHVDHAIVEEAYGEMHCGDGFCAGVAPVVADRSRCNLTVVADSRRFGRRIARDPREFVRHAIERLPRLRERVPAAATATPDILASGPFDVPVSRVAAPGVALTGDAAGYYDPFTGQGIHQALVAAELLADAAGTFLHAAGTGSTSTALDRYADTRRALLRAPRLLQHVIEAVLARPRIANLAIARIADAPAFAAAIIAVTGDVAPVRSLLAPRALLSLLPTA